MLQTEGFAAVRIPLCTQKQCSVIKLLVISHALFLPVNSFLIAVSCVLSKGTQISCSHLIGRGRLDNAKELAGTAILTGLSVSVAFSLIMIFFPERAAVLLGASPDVTNQIEYTAGYLCAYAYGVPAMIILDTLMCSYRLPSA